MCSSNVMQLHLCLNDDFFTDLTYGSIALPSDNLILFPVQDKYVCFCILSHNNVRDSLVF